MKIPRGKHEGTDATPGPCWFPTVNSAGVHLKPVIKCRCGAIFGLGLHHVHADGRVTASFYHPINAGDAGCADSGPGCGFHEFIELADYDGGEFPPGGGE